MLEEILAWIPLAAAGISALGSLGGSFMSASGAASANAQNVAAQNMANQQMLNAQMAKHAQDTAFMEDSQAHAIFAQDMAQQFSSGEAEKARYWGADQARRQMDFQAQMSNTAYQRSMADMKAAGLNPMLAYQQGGSSTPQGAAGPAPAASSSGVGAGMSSGPGAPSLKAAQVLNDKEAIGRAMGNFLTTALNVVRGFEDIQLVKQQNKESQQREVVGAAQAVNLHYDTENKKMEHSRIQEETELRKAQTKSAYGQAAVSHGEAGNLDRYGSRQAPDTIERLLRSLQGWFEKSGSPIPAPAPWDNSPKLF